MLHHYDRLGQPIGLMRWAELHADPDYKIVVQENVGPYWVSTVWLGTDHNFWGHGPPIIFETMVFASDSESRFGPDIECNRYSTEAEALQGHADTITLIRATLVEELPELSQPESSDEPGKQ